MASTQNIVASLVTPPGAEVVVEPAAEVVEAGRVAGADEVPQDRNGVDETNKGVDETNKGNVETDGGNDETGKAKGQPKTPRFDYNGFRAVSRGFNVTSHGQNLTNQMNALKELLSFRYGQDAPLAGFKADEKIIYALFHTKKVRIASGAPEVPFSEIPGFRRLMQAIEVEEPALKEKKDKKADSAAANAEYYQLSCTLYWAHYDEAITQMAARCQSGHLQLTVANTQIAHRYAAKEYLDDPCDIKKPFNHILYTMIHRNMTYEMACKECLPPPRQKKRKADAVAAPAENNTSA